MHRLVSLLRDQGRRCPRLYWPLALAEDRARLVAGIGTHVKHGLVLAGPIALDPALARRAPVIAYRLGEVYDRAMASAGIRLYYCYAAADLPQWQYTLERLGYEPVPVPGEPGQWYKRWAGQPWGQQLDSSHAEPVDGLRQRLRGVPVDAL